MSEMQSRSFEIFLKSEHIWRWANSFTFTILYQKEICFNNYSQQKKRKNEEKTLKWFYQVFFITWITFLSWVLSRDFTFTPTKFHLYLTKFVILQKKKQFCSLCKFFTNSESVWWKCLVSGKWRVKI